MRSGNGLLNSLRRERRFGWHFWWNLWWFELIEDAFWRLGLCKLAATFVLATKLCLWVAPFWEFVVFETHIYQINCVYAF